MATPDSAVFEKIVKQIRPMFDSGVDRGLVCVFDGFFVYEDVSGLCTAVVAPRVQHSATNFWGVLLEPSGSRSELFREQPKRVIRATVTENGSGGTGARALSNPPHGDFQWLPAWTEYMQATPLPETWRNDHQNTLLFELPLTRGAVFAVPDRDKEEEWTVDGRQFRQRVSTVGAVVIGGPGVLTVAGSAREFGRAAEDWLTLIVSHRQSVPRSEGQLIGHRQIADAHHRVLAALHGFAFDKVNVSGATEVGPKLTRPLESIDGLVSVLDPSPFRPDTPGEVGCNGCRVCVRRPESLADGRRDPTTSQAASPDAQGRADSTGSAALLTVEGPSDAIELELTWEGGAAVLATLTDNGDPVAFGYRQGVGQNGLTLRWRSPEASSHVLQWELWFEGTRTALKAAARINTSGPFELPVSTQSADGRWGASSRAGK